MSNGSAGKDYICRDGKRGTAPFLTGISKRRKKNKRAKASRRKNR